MRSRMSTCSTSVTAWSVFCSTSGSFDCARSRIRYASSGCDVRVPGTVGREGGTSAERPLSAPIEGGSDRHAIALQQETCRLYELFNAQPAGDRWMASSGAVFDLRSNALRPEGWTSADAAGLPILPGLAKYDEVKSGRITHALRVTVGQTQRGYIYPATHWASSDADPDLPPMGLRLRLRADFDLSPYTGDTRVILEALKTYGLIVADNGTSWYITGAMDPRWDDDDLNQLKTVPGSAFEAVDTGPIVRP
jgi:hypothetical protein